MDVERHQRARGPVAQCQALCVRLLGLGGHLLAISLVACVLGYGLLSAEVLRVVLESVQAGAFAGGTLRAVLVHLLLSASLWGCLVALVGRARGPRARRPMLLVVQRGSVMVETLIVLPVFLLMTFGIAQLALNNIAVVLANAATFQASRSAWLWLPEARVGRLGNPVSDPMEFVAEKARLQAAAVLTPVAPGDYLRDPDLPEVAEKARAIFIASQTLFPGTDSGADALQDAPGLATRSASAHTTSFVRAFDTTSFVERTARKFTWAYRLSEVEVLVDDAGEELTVNLTYHHLCVMPLVGAIFGDWMEAGGMLTGHFSTIRRSFTRGQQGVPGKKWPRGAPYRTIEYY